MPTWYEMDTDFGAPLGRERRQRMAMENNGQRISWLEDRLRGFWGCSQPLDFAWFIDFRSFARQIVLELERSFKMSTPAERELIEEALVAFAEPGNSIMPTMKAAQKVLAERAPKPRYFDDGSPCHVVGGVSGPDFTLRIIRERCNDGETRYVGEVISNCADAVVEFLNGKKP